MSRFAKSRWVPGWSAETLSLVLLFSIEAGIFYWQLAKQITPFYPTNFDQAFFIDQVYVLYRGVLTDGWTTLVKFPFRFPNNTGTGLLMQGVIAVMIGGLRRASLLTLNFVYFIALQCCLYITIRRRTQKVDFSWITLGLLLACASLFNDAGGIFDFRFDFAAFCLYGALISVITLSRAFRDRQITLVAAIIAALLILVRYIATVYIATIVACFAVTLWLRVRSPQPFVRAFAKQRLRNLRMFSVVTAILTLPVLIVGARLIYDKYVGQHLLGSEKYMRSTELGVHDFAEHVLFYPRSIILHHLGAITLELALALLLLTGFMMGLQRTPAAQFCHRLRQYRFEFAVLIIAVVGPIAILTLDISISPVVGGIVVGPTVLAFVLGIAALWLPMERVMFPDDLVATARRLAWWPSLLRLRGSTAMRLSRFALVIVAAITFAHNSKARQHQLSSADLERISELNDRIVRYALENKISTPLFSIDRVVDFLNPATLDVAGYEHFNAELHFGYGLGYDGTYGFNAAPRDAALKLVKNSDIVVLTDPTLGRDTPYPMNAAIKKYWAELMASAMEDRLPLWSTTIAGIPYKVFGKPQNQSK